MISSWQAAIISRYRSRPWRSRTSPGPPSSGVRRRFAFGVPTESVHWATAAGVRPGVGSVILADADAIARTVLALSDDLLTNPTDPTDPTGPETIEVSLP